MKTKWRRLKWRKRERVKLNHYKYMLPILCALQIICVDLGNQACLLLLPLFSLSASWTVIIVMKYYGRTIAIHLKTSNSWSPPSPLHKSFHSEVKWIRSPKNSINIAHSVCSFLLFPFFIWCKIQQYIRPTTK